MIRRMLRPFLALSLVFASAAAQQRGDGIPVADPTLGVQHSVMTLPPGWHGSARMDHTTDPLSLGVATLVFDVTSGDGKAHVVTLPKAFHTYSPARRMTAATMSGNPLNQPNAAFVPFTSTADLLIRYILPKMNIPGQRNANMFAPNDEMKARMGAGGPQGGIYDAATALYVHGSTETAVAAHTTGTHAGTPQEYSTTYLTVSTAPVGQSLNALVAQGSIKQAQPNPQWLQANERYLATWRQLFQQRHQAIAAASRPSGGSSGGGNSASAAINAETDRKRAAFYDQQQKRSDNAANASAYYGDRNVSFKWCGSGGDVKYTVNNTTPPGPGYSRCN